MFRWIDELNNMTNADEMARAVKSEIRRIKKEENSPTNKREIKRLYAELDRIQYKSDYLLLIIDKEKDYYRACNGFSVNGIKYKRLLGTNGGIKNSTIVFVSESLSEELRRRVENDRDQTKPLVTAKLEAYKALTCSASTPVSTPNGILIVNDAETKFLSDIVYLSDEQEGEPLMEERKNQEIVLDASDGFGLMSPALATRWSEELQLDYTVSACNTRFSFEKGVLFTFDFVDFAEKVAGGNYIVKDAWGNDVDVRNVEAIFTTSMVKLWDSYKSCEDYLQKSIRNGYTFGVTKTSPKELENERNLNYQFIQSYQLSDEDIEELIAPTMNEIRDVLGGDWRKTAIFLNGQNLTEKNIENLDNDISKAIMIDRRVIDDPYVQDRIYRQIRNRINEAKVGVLKVHGNYSIVSGDPYALCQSIFGLEVTGLLKAGEIYNHYWSKLGVEKLACFRAPMTTHANIRMVYPVNNEEVNYWYQHIKTCTIFNAWDTATAALNGCDFDGDIVMLTDNDVLVRNLIVQPALMCAQRRADKCIPTEEDFVKSNIASFGNEIGQTTNYITSMYEVRSRFEPGSKEYETLSYRIKCGQLYQQNSIDKAKGIVCKPMPKYWHDRHAANRIEDDEEREFCRRIVADKKPYFMRYIYPQLMKQYNAYVKNTNRNALREFQMTIEELLAVDSEILTERQQEFLKFYKIKMPVGTAPCVMNRICRRFEEEFDGYLCRHNSNTNFDYTFMKSDAEYTAYHFRDIKKAYEEYIRRTQIYAIFSDYERVDKDEAKSALTVMYNEFDKRCSVICPNRYSLCNIILDICYTKSMSKKFAWSICGLHIIDNLLMKNNGVISFPTADANGDILYGGNRFKMVEKKIEVID